MGRFPKGMRVPENYSGNAFSSPKEPPPPFEETAAEDVAVSASPPPEDEEKNTGEYDTPTVARPSFKLDLGRFFSGNKSFGMEEFLIIALILLIAQNDTNDDTLIFLILLLFIR